MEPAIITVRPLPSLREQLSTSFAFVRQRYDLWLLMLAGSLPLTLVLILIGVTEGDFSGMSPWLWVVCGVAMLASPIIAVIAMYCALYPETNPSITDGWHWLWAHFGSVVWILTLIPIIMFGAAVFFIIPMMVVSVYMMLVTAVLVYENKRGFAAVWRSHELVYGHWWTVLARVLVVGLLYGIATVVVSFFATLILGPLGELIGSAVQVAGTLAIYYMLHDFYHAFASEDQSARAASPASFARLFYKTSAVIGTLIFIGIVGLMSLFIVMLMGNFAP